MFAFCVILSFHHPPRHIVLEPVDVSKLSLTTSRTWKTDRTSQSTKRKWKAADEADIIDSNNLFSDNDTYESEEDDNEDPDFTPGM